MAAINIDDATAVCWLINHVHQYALQKQGLAGSLIHHASI
jgi:hypothetical protein